MEPIGRQIYILDKVSAIATDVLMEKVPNYRERNLAGYLLLQEAGDDLRPKASYLVTFFTKDEPTRIAYEIRIKPNAAPECRRTSRWPVPELICLGPKRKPFMTRDDCHEDCPASGWADYDGSGE
jgi:hypothetical protein